MKLLETINLKAGYKKARDVIRDINLNIEEGVIAIKQVKYRLWFRHFRDL